ncbi:RidA family protein [Nocardia asteroides]|uniref:RidA family protein n=1 Tax=Nocardia asteroides TaxID=1824 RepID=UPI00379A8B89
MDRAFTNLGIALRSAGADYRDVAQLRTFIVAHDLEKLTILGTKIAEIWGPTPPTQTLLGVSALALPDMLFEVDALAVLP